jgi:hypothetical protein
VARQAALLVIALALTPAVAQTPPRPDPAARQPLREDPTDYWADVHRWTGSDATRPRAAARAPAPAGAAAAAVPGRTVTTTRTSRANIRREPATTAPVLRSVPPGTVLNVFAEGPEGWLQVGNGARPTGWIHPSALAP